MDGENTMIKFETKLNQDAGKNIGNNAIKNVMKKLIPLCVAIVIFGVIMFFLDGLFYLALFLVIFGVGLVPITYISQKRQVSSSAVLDSGIVEEYIVNPDYIEIHQSNAEGYEAFSKYPFSLIKKIEKNGENYFVTTVFNQIHLLSLNNLTEGTTEELDAIFTNALGTMFVKK